MDILDMIGKVIEEGIGEKKREYMVPIADLTEEQYKEFREYKNKKAEMEESLELKIKEIELQFKKIMREEVHPLKEKLEIMHDEYWDKITKELQLEPDGNYTIKGKEKRVYQYVKPIEEENIQ